MSSIEFPPACEAIDPDDDSQECIKPINHGGRFHGNKDHYWPVTARRTESDHA